MAFADKTVTDVCEWIRSKYGTCWDFVEDVIEAFTGTFDLRFSSKYMIISVFSVPMIWKEPSAGVLTLCPRRATLVAQ